MIGQTEEWIMNLNVSAAPSWNFRDLASLVIPAEGRTWRTSPTYGLGPVESYSATEKGVQPQDLPRLLGE